MMHNAVAEISGPDLSGFWTGHDKHDGSTGCVLTGLQFVVQVHQVSLQSLLKRQRIPGVALGATAIEIRMKKLRNSQVTIHDLISPPDGTNIVGIVLIVVVLVAVIEVLVPSVRCGILGTGPIVVRRKRQGHALTQRDTEVSMSPLACALSLVAQRAWPAMNGSLMMTVAPTNLPSGSRSI